MHFKLVKVLILAVLMSPLATAANFSFTGSFATDNSIQLFGFTLISTETVTLRTYSYAGGVNQAGNVIPQGGFDPILSLFDNTGVLINENDDGSSNVPADSVTGQHYDSYILTTLAAGTYTVSLTQYNSFANGPDFSNGFLRMGDPNFTNVFGCTNGRFCDVTGNSRTSNWAFDVSGATSATTVNIPEPKIVALLGISMLLIGFCRCKVWNIFYRQ